MSVPSGPRIYYHVGLGKAASTYLQKAVFPHLRGIHYINRNRFGRHRAIIASGDADRFLVSREGGRFLNGRVREFASRYPDAFPMIVLRRHDHWLASHYRRYVKNGGRRSFREFFDLDADQGLWKRDELLFMPKIELLEARFSHRPLVLFHEQLRTDSDAFFERLTAHLGASIERDRVSLDTIHSSYGDAQLKVLQAVARRLFRREPHEIGSWIGRRLRMYACYVVLHGSRLLPRAWIPGGELIPAHELERIRIHYRADWQRCMEYAGSGS